MTDRRWLLLACAASVATFGCAVSHEDGSPTGSDVGAMSAGDPWVPACSAVSPVVPPQDPAAAQLSALLAPSATLDELDLASCPWFVLTGRAGKARQAFVEALQRKLGWETLTDVVVVEPTMPGDAAFTSLLDRVADQLAERGQPAPASVISALAATGPYLEIPLRVELDECSQRAVARIDRVTGRVLLLRQNPLC